jgi:hypothetical protein
MRNQPPVRSAADAELGEQSSAQADALATGILPLRADAVQPLEGLVIHRLDRHRLEIRIAAGPQQASASAESVLLRRT